MRHLKKYEFVIPIGDWSDDGHGKCDYFYVKSNKSVNEVKNIDNKVKDITGIDVHEFANECSDNIVPNDVIDKLKKLGFDISTLEIYKEKYYVYSENIFSIWIFLLMKTDKELRITEREYPKLQGDFVGYGCF